MRLGPAGELQEGLVSLGYSPAIDHAFKDRCLSSGLFYLLRQAFFEVDTGPPIDYGYVNPSTGEPIPPRQRTPPGKPICRCDLRDSGREWVAYSREMAAELE
jgi:hypothetical protein